MGRQAFYVGGSPDRLQRLCLLLEHLIGFAHPLTSHKSGGRQGVTEMLQQGFRCLLIKPDRRFLWIECGNIAGEMQGVVLFRPLHTIPHEFMERGLRRIGRKHQHDHPVNGLRRPPPIDEGCAGIPIRQSRCGNPHLGQAPVNTAQRDSDNRAPVDQSRQREATICIRRYRRQRLNLVCPQKVVQYLS